MAGALAQPPPQDVALPPLREDLQIVRGGASYSGAPVWIVLDPIRNRFFRITYELFQLLSLWNKAGSAMKLGSMISAQFGRQVEPEELQAAVKALDASFFFTTPATGSWRSLHDRAQQKHSLLMQGVHNYLFFKIPLVRPNNFLRSTWPLVSALFTRTFLYITIAAGLVGLYLVSRQWEAFKGTFPYVFTLEGAAISLVSIWLIKSLHELGHGYVAHHYGCRVPTMGVAMMVLMPLLYTDVSDAWRLQSRRQRLAIDSAGMLVEFAVAAWALLLWSFLPEGPMRSAVFVLAAVGWVLSLVVNTNPFMRFDGYYILADLVGIENLQPRAFRHMRWRLRNFFFDSGEPMPEPFPWRVDVFLTIYAIATAIYRVILYIGIALLVYHFFIKLVGILLFIVEVVFFMIRPVWHELRVWFSMRDEILASRRTWFSLAVLLGLVALCFLPLSARVSAPAVLQPARFARLYPEEAGRITAVNIQRGQNVRQGDVLLEIESPNNQHERKLADIEIALAELRLARIGAEEQDRVESGTIRRQLASLQTQRSGLDERDAKLVVRAPFDGIVTDISPSLIPGRWVGRSQFLAFLAQGEGLVIRAYIEGNYRGRIETGAPATFVPKDLTRPKVAARLDAVSAYSVTRLELPELGSVFGGPVAVYEHSNRSFSPASAQYALRASVQAEGSSITQMEAGTLLIEASPESLASRLWRVVARVFVREFGL